MRTIGVFADIRCPFTHVGVRRLVQRPTQLGGRDIVVRVRSWPLELVNNEPLDPDLIGEEIDALRAQVVPDLFNGFDASRLPASSIPALMLAATAYGHSLATGERVSLALRDSLFEHGADIADTRVLAVMGRRRNRAPHRRRG